MELRVLDHALQHRGQHRLDVRVLRQFLECLLQEVVELLLEHLDVAAARAHGHRRVTIVQQREQQMFERHVLVTPFDSLADGELERRL